MSPGARYVLRAVLVGVGALLASLAQATYGSDLELGEVIFAASSGFAAALAYAGLGAASRSVEPSVGRQGT